MRALEGHPLRSRSYICRQVGCSHLLPRAGQQGQQASMVPAARSRCSAGTQRREGPGSPSGRACHGPTRAGGPCVVGNRFPLAGLLRGDQDCGVLS